MLAALAQAGRVEPAVALGEFLLGAALDAGRPAAPHVARRRREGNRLPRGLRRRRLRPDRAARRDRRPALAARGAPARALAVELFADDEAGGFFQTPGDGEQLVARKKELDDHPTPSGNAMLAYVLLRLARIWGDDELEQRRRPVLRLVRDALRRAPSAFGWMLVALDQHLAPHRELAIVGPPDAPSRARRSRARRRPTSSPSGRPTTSRCSRAGRWSTACRRLRLRAVRLPPAGDRPGERLSSAADGAALRSQRHAPLRRDRRDRRRLARRRAGPDRRADRPERRRQDDALQHRHAALPAGLRRRSSSTARACCARRRTASSGAGSHARSRTSSSSGR